MILRIKKFFEANLVLTKSTSHDDIEHRLRLTCAALMLEMIYVDDKTHKAEEKKIRSMLKQNFELTDLEMEELLALALEEKDSATDYHQFTSLINEHFSQEQKIQLIEMLWELAFADNVLDKYEEHLIRKLADLIHVPHKHFIQTRHKVEDKL